jgi:hypothetical protein
MRFEQTFMQGKSNKKSLHQIQMFTSGSLNQSFMFITFCGIACYVKMEGFPGKVPRNIAARYGAGHPLLLLTADSVDACHNQSPKESVRWSENGSRMSDCCNHSPECCSGMPFPIFTHNGE